MKTKFYLLTLILACCVTFPQLAYGASPYAIQLRDDGEGQSPFNPRSDASTVTAIQEETTIGLTFNSMIGIINVLIINANGATLYKKQVDTKNIYNMNISISGLQKGVYTISFTTTSGIRMIYGNFTVN